MANIFVGLISNFFFWLSTYLIGYLITILLLLLLGVEKINKKIPQLLLELFILLVFVLPLIAIPFSQGRKLTNSLPITFFVLIIGGIIFLASIAIRITAQRQIKVFLSLKTKEKLVTTGIYKTIRNPLYLSNGLFSLGLSLLANSLYAFLFSILYSFLYLPIIFFEEKNLLEKYKDDYEKYKRETPWKLIPKII
ncbi:MAG TPA: isoprenylcysteine carboxylmethyltransferase family protein [Candidatus Portnoybacteria bacterium]|nr:isoprenylcysteine carboxylmethyltransferase family protein [Candidatus Portnoybacteria bacterium]